MTVLVGAVTFLAAGVEWVEALTIVLAVGLVKGWRSALAGTVAAMVALILLVGLFGVAFTAYISPSVVRTVVGVFLLLFGLKWLHKAILRSSDLVALHDEAKAFEATREHLQTAAGGRAGSLDWVGATTSFNGVFLEGLEVVFIVVALGGLHSLPAAAAGALVSLVVVAALGIALRSPLTRIPENAMKYVVGIMLTAFGTFFTGEGIGVTWPGQDLILLPLIAVYGLASLLFVLYLKNPPRIDLVRVAPLRVARAILLEVWGLFVGDGALAIFALAALLAVAVFADRASGRRGLAGALLVVGVLAAVAVGLADTARRSGAGKTARAQPGEPGAGP